MATPALSWRPGTALELTGNLLLALLYALFLSIFLRSFAEHHRLSSLLVALVESAFLYLSVVRRPPREFATTFTAWATAFAGTFIPLLLRPDGSADMMAGTLVQVIGIVFIGFAILSLGRSFGLVAANRGVVTVGMYRHVRHPLYLAYTVYLFGFLLNNPTALNTLIFVAALAAQVARIHQEESVLRHDSGYRTYMEATRWRLLPYLY